MKLPIDPIKIAALFIESFCERIKHPHINVMHAK